MRILHIITSLNTGGAEVMLQKLLRAHRDRYELHVLSLTSKARIGAELEAEGISTVSLGCRRGALFPFRLRQLIRTYQNVRPDIVHAWMYHANVAAQILVRSTARPARPGLVLSVRAAVHVPGADAVTTRLVRRIDAAMSQSADVVIFNSHRSADQHIASGYDGRNAVVIPNGFDTALFSPNPAERSRLRSELGCQNALLVGLVARFDRFKDHRTFLEAAQIVAGSDPRCRFLLCGPGCDSENAQLMRWIAELRLTGLVYALGERRDMVSVQNALEIAVCSSISEGFPNAIGEAMACGVPAVVTDVGDCQILVGDTGAVVPARDPMALAHAILQLSALSDAERAARGARARERIIANFSLESVANEFARVYEKCPVAATSVVHVN
jgi:glycosyltransferase involved in cell wall biosynthesis